MTWDACPSIKRAFSQRKIPRQLSFTAVTTQRNTPTTTESSSTESSLAVLNLWDSLRRGIDMDALRRLQAYLDGTPILLQMCKLAAASKQKIKGAPELTLRHLGLAMFGGSILRTASLYLHGASSVSSDLGEFC